MRKAIILAMLIGLFGAVSAVKASNDDPKLAREKTHQAQNDNDRSERASHARTEKSETDERKAREHAENESDRHDAREDRH